MKHILVVDDREENRYVLRVLMQGHGFTVSEAEHGVDALEQARTRKPDLAVSDLLMPTMDGYTLLREWKADPVLHAVPFIVYTATYTGPKDEKLARDMGADAFIIKPAEPEELVREVQAVLAQAVAGRLSAHPPQAAETVMLKDYNAVLVAKLEERTAELEAHVAELDRARHQILRLNRLYRALSETNQAIIHTADPATLYETLCRIAVDRGGLAMAWIGLLDAGSGVLTPVGRYGALPPWVERLAPLSGRGELRIPAEIAVGEGRAYLCNDLLADPALVAIHDDLRAKGLAAAAAFPLVADGRMLGCMALFSGEKGFFDLELTELVREMADDVAFAVDHFGRELRRRRAEEASRLMGRAVEASVNGIALTDPQQPGNPLVYVNPAFERITGYAAGEVMGLDPCFLIGADHDQLGIGELEAAIAEGTEAAAVLRAHRKDGSLFWSELSVAPVRDADGRLTHFVCVINDVTERKIYEETLERQYNEDALTGLASRNLLRDRCGQGLAFSRQRQRVMALMMIDLDHFKRINDSLGHEAGDVLLRTVAQRITAVLRERDTVARLGGDEFVVLLADLGDAGSVPLVADKILHVFDTPVKVGEREIDVTASLGISVYPQDGEDYDTLLRNAETAMYGAKQAGRNAFRFYTADMNAEALKKLELEAQLRRALARGDLLLHYQPICEADSGRVIGVEALLRCRDDDGRLMAPGEFIPLAEETGLIMVLGEWALLTACRQARRWQQAGWTLRVAVNLSTRQFRDAQLAERVRECLAGSGLPAALLKLEITESAVMEDAERAAQTLAELKALGVAISVDDFGTGYSSLAYLRRFPIDQLKIDRSFVSEVTRHPDSASIVRGIIDLAHSLRLKTVAEGVETEEEQIFLREAGCDLVQGYLHARPMEAEALERWLATREAGGGGAAG